MSETLLLAFAAGGVLGALIAWLAARAENAALRARLTESQHVAEKTV
ncbi:MAG: hypothetical protein JO241_08320, partial [Candidatus Eremiobacteraeota bacterium]|nr:hypothetical protein [Candidatus Eremiobacteraeota bacterium]